MARLDIWLRDHPSRWIACLEFLVKGLNYTLACVGLGMMAYAIDAYVHYHDLPNPQAVLYDELPSQQPLMLSASYQNGTDPDSHGVTVPLNWIIAVFGAAGLLTTLTACTAIVGASIKSLCCINTNVVLMSLLCAGQLCLAVAAFVYDRNGEERPDSIRAFLHHKLIVFKWVWLAVAITELVTLSSNCMLQATYTRAQETAEDREADTEWRVRQPLIRSTQAAVATTPERNDAWSQRMREHYGVDTAQLTYDPEHTMPPAPAPTLAPAPRQQKRCAIM